MKGQGGSASDLIKSAIPLSRYVAQFTEESLSPSGNGKWKTACPIHGGDNPTAFNIDDNIGLWKCFSGDCGGGSIIDFWMKYNNNEDFLAALDALAGELNVNLPEPESRRPSRRRVHAALEAVADAAHEFLFSDDPEAKIARKYLGQRKVKKKVARRWLMGMLPSGIDAVDFIKDAHDDIPALEEAQLIARNERGGTHWAPMNGRLLFPISNDQNRIVAMGAREIPDVKHSLQGKYVNSSNSLVYDKSSTLYGMENITQDTEHVLIVEGYFDVIAINEAMDNDPHTVAVATCGTSIAKGHLEALKQAKTITNVFDGDLAGKKALVKSLWSANYFGTRLNAVILEDEADPWDLYTEGEHDRLADLAHEGLPIVTMAVRAQGEILDYNEYDLTEWVKSTAPSLEYGEHKDQLISDTARLIGKSPAKYKQSLALPTDFSAKYAEKHSVDSMSPNTRTLCSALIKMDRDDMDGILAAFRPWGTKIENLIRSWMPVSTDTDIQVIKKLTLGIDAPSDSRIDQIVASLMNDEDEADIRVILRGLIKQLLTAISSMPDIQEYLVSQIRNLRKALDLTQAVEYHPSLLAYLIDISSDIEREIIQHEKLLARSS